MTHLLFSEDTHRDASSLPTAALSPLPCTKGAQSECSASPSHWGSLHRGQGCLRQAHGLIWFPLPISPCNKYRVASGHHLQTTLAIHEAPHDANVALLSFTGLENRSLPSGFSAKQEPQQVHSCSPTASNFQALLCFRQPLLSPALLP